MQAEALPFLSITEVDDGPFFVAELFRRKFGGDPPREGRHLVAFHRGAAAEFQVAGYAHFRPFGDLILVGGVCTDGAAFARMTPVERDAIGAAGGVYLQILKYGFAAFASQCEAFFGYCGDARAEVVNLQAGFRKTEHPYLLAHFHKPQHEVMQRALIAKAAAIGPF
jgi:hypothetical protein